MKRITCGFLSILLCLLFSACSNSEKHIGEAKTPSGSKAMQGRNYQDVIETFEEKGFTNIRVEKIEDLIFGWLTDDGEVEKVTIDGNEDYSSDKWISADTEVIIYYHTFPSDEDVETTNPSENNSEIKTQNREKIVMPFSSADYCGEDWTIETLTEHLTNLGFTNIVSTACDPDDDCYRSNIFEIYIETGLFSTDPWEAGEEYNSDAEISIYYNELPLLTIDNCPDLASILTSKEMDYMSFANLYDGRYVEFDAYVTTHLTYHGNTGHVIDVTGGDYDGVKELEDLSGDAYDGWIIHIGEGSLFASIDETVQPGDHVRVSGVVDYDWSDYYNCIHVETLILERR